MIKRRLLGLILIFVMILGISNSFLANTQPEDMEDPEYWSAQGYISDSFYSKPIEYKYQNVGSTPGRGDYTLRKGIDVSSLNGEIDWSIAKNAGVEFAIIRVGYRGYGTGKLVADANYIKNIEGALENGIQVGVYIYSQAITVEEAIEEAEFVMERVYEYNITLPIVIDFEYYSGKDGESGRLYDANLSVEAATEICSTFCDTVEDAGYVGMVYANKYMLSNKIDGNKLAEDYHIWLAHYTTQTNYNGIYDFWQYTSTGDGYAHGMESQYVDLNWWYDDGSFGKWIQDEGGWKYKKADGAYATDCWLRIVGQWYAFNEYSYMREGWFWDGAWYFLNYGSGAMATGWVNDGGTWYYMKPSGAMATGWVNDGSTWYYMNRSGAMATGWINDAGTWYYMNGSGAMATGWVNDCSTWYYMNGSGAMATGWINDAGTWYYMNGSGAMATGWVNDGGEWYYMHGSGAMATGWIFDGGEWYYMYGSGAMATGWIQDGGNWYYLYDNGVMAHDTWIDDCYVDNSGVWVI